MKAKHVFVTLGVALTMGLGVAASFGLSKGMKEAKAWPSSDWSHAYVVGSFAESNWTNYIELTKPSESEDYQHVFTFAKGDMLKITSQPNWTGHNVDYSWGQITGNDHGDGCWKSLTEDDGTSHFYAYAKGSGNRYQELFRTAHGEVKETRTSVIFQLRFPKKLGKALIEAMHRDETDEQQAFIKTRQTETQW